MLKIDRNYKQLWCAPVALSISASMEALAEPFLPATKRSELTAIPVSAPAAASAAPEEMKGVNPPAAVVTVELGVVYLC
jgi:hypothetical protein